MGLPQNLENIARQAYLEAGIYLHNLGMETPKLLAQEEVKQQFEDI